MKISPGIRNPEETLLLVLFLLALVALLSAVATATLSATGHLDVVAIGEQVRRWMKL